MHITTPVKLTTGKNNQHDRTKPTKLFNGKK